ncbi:MAG: PTS system mannose/fructose/sorbose family transporter subunit IID [Erysipelotrichaceae bacterium]|nr:PTS system mannose/fructose/sorbose family transporter subunit IID [Erysipelotrichaceae bacterium]
MAEKKLTKKDLVSLFIRSNAVQSAFSFERQQAMGFEYAMIPVINKLYDSEEERINGYKRHLNYFNSHPWTCGIIFGIVASMEERRANGEDVDEANIQAIKTGLMGPLAGIGDSFFWGALRPIVAGICASLALEGYSIAPLLFVVVMNVIHFGLHYWEVMKGYEMAEGFLDTMDNSSINIWMEAATILGLFVVGGLSATWLNVTTKLTYTVGESTTAIQKALDGIMPKLLSLLSVLAVYYLLRKGKKTTTVMLILVVVGFVLGYFNII